MIKVTLECSMQETFVIYDFKIVLFKPFLVGYSNAFCWKHSIGYTHIPWLQKGCDKHDSESNSPLGVCTGSLILGKFSPRSPREQLLQPKVGWSTTFQVVNDKARLREEIVLGRNHLWKMKKKLNFACFPVSWPQEIFLMLWGKKNQRSPEENRLLLLYL